MKRPRFRVAFFYGIRIWPPGQTIFHRYSRHTPLYPGRYGNNLTPYP